MLNDETIPRLKCKLIAGAANNQLADGERHCKMIEARGISYGVDFILNAGGAKNENGCSYEKLVSEKIACFEERIQC